MHKTSRFTQTIVYVKKNARLFKNQKDWKFIAIAAVISVLVCAIVGDDMFDTYDSTNSGFFAIVSAAIWIGVFNSIQRICKEHETIRSEYRSGLHISAYVMSHVIFDFALCLSQALILLVVCCIFIDFPTEGVILGSAIAEYFITFFLIIWCSDIMGIMISSVASNPNVAMTAMPFVLILQLVMSGVLFKLSGLSEKIANVTYSKWGMSALGSIGDIANLELKIIDKNPELAEFIDRDKVLDSATIKSYEHTPENLRWAWCCILIIGIACILISGISLKIRNKDS